MVVAPAAVEIKSGDEMCSIDKAERNGLHSVSRPLMSVSSVESALIQCLDPFIKHSWPCSEQIGLSSKGPEAGQDAESL